MERVLSTISQYWHNLLGVLGGITVGDILDIIIVTFLIYKAIQFVRETHAGQLLKGLIILLVVNIVVRALNMTMMSMLLQAVWSIGFIAVIILFQPELRNLLERIGRSKFKFLGKGLTIEDSMEYKKESIGQVCKAAGSLSSSKTGALMVFENLTILDSVIKSGSPMDANVSYDLLCNIFFPKAPLHDGAVVIRENKIAAASCILPLTATNDLNRELGTRHRAAIGMTEQSDAVVVVVSEETGIISVAFGGQIERGFDSVTLKTRLEELLITETPEQKGKEMIKSQWKRWFK
ncbi:MAG: diadenylate cyclase CdaA [Clostridia bacterium]|nr:diadenylate cyclase CdaA [Clostridia bacterium]